MSETVIYNTIGANDASLASANANGSALSWAAVLGGAVVATATTLVLVALGSGLGLAWISPLRGDNPSATGFTLVAAVWLIVVQWVAAGLGGYIAGRMRGRWPGLHTHEVFFRDTAHGFLTWATATVIVVALITAAAASVAGTATRAAATVAGGAARGASQGAMAQANTPSAYAIDRLFRRTPQTEAAAPGNAAGNASDAHNEAVHILARDVTDGDVPAGDRTYLAQLVAAQTGLSPADAQKRVDALITQEQAAKAKALQAADEARKISARASIFTAVSMLIGAFIACAAAALGGTWRDEHP